MTRGTTPTLNFTLPFASSNITTLNISFVQSNRIKFEKILTDCTKSGNTLTVTLTQAETLKLDSSHPLEIQIRCKCGNTTMASQIMSVDVQRILKEGII